jgi:hypothetical protein
MVFQIHDVVSLSQEALHSMKSRKIPSFIMKLDLSKDYDKVNWTFMHLSLIQMGINLNIVNWIMGCIESSSLAVLINDSPSSFFHPSRGLHQGCPLSPFIFLLVADGLSRLIHQSHGRNIIKWLKVSQEEFLTHLLFVDDIIIFGAGSTEEIKTWKEIMDSFYATTGMQINIGKYVVLTNELGDQFERSTKGASPLCIQKYR